MNLLNSLSRSLAAAAFAASLLSSAHAASVELLTNGDFETGTFAGWTATTRTGSNGSLAISTPGTITPNGGQATAANPLGGTAYAVTSQNGPGAYSLMQAFTVNPSATSVMLTFQMFANNYAAETFFGEQGLDFAGVANQHARVDLLSSTAGPFDLGAVELANFYLGADLGPNPNPYTSYMFDITSLVGAGGTYQLRFAQVDNQLFFNMGVDNVSVLAQFNQVPEPGSFALAALALIGVGFARRRTRQ